jgi:UDPglucose 6-dehydrogenase
MGTTVNDFLYPEFVLLGSDDLKALYKLEMFYSKTVSAPIKTMTIEEAELTKVTYNTFIGQKIVFANTLGQICEEMGINVDNVTDTLKIASKRLISPTYLSAGMGDAGACHPRDSIAMSWLSQQLNLGYDLFESVMLAREEHAVFLANLVLKHSEGLPIIIL